jgi:hypothetical protein
MVRRGRARGIGVTLVTQRAAVLSKDVLTQVEVLVALRTIAPQDREAIDAWIQAHDAHGQRGEFMTSLASLPIGTAWFWSPGWLDVFRKVAIRKRTTFDSSATPKVGETVRAPKQLAPVDLEALKGQITATIERAKAEDPRELRRQVAELKAQLARSTATHNMHAVSPNQPKRVEIPVLSAAHLTRLEAAIRQADKAIEKLGATKDGAQTAITAIATTMAPLVAELKALRVGPTAAARIAVHVAPTARPEILRALGQVLRMNATRPLTRARLLPLLLLVLIAPVSAAGYGGGRGLGYGGLAIIPRGSNVYDLRAHPTTFGPLIRMSPETICVRGTVEDRPEHERIFWTPGEQYGPKYAGTRCITIQ